MSLTHREIKLLWGQTGNVCAFPGCEQRLVENGVVIGEMCHIFGEKPGSNRHNPSVPTEYVDGIKNRIVLCPTHHTIIDKPELENTYTVETLTEWKTNHKKANAGTPMSEYLITTVIDSINPYITQVAINSPRAIQALGDVNITHAPPSLTLLRCEGAAEGAEYFGGRAVLYFGARPAAAFEKVIIDLTVEGIIENFTKAIVGSGMVMDTTFVGPSLDSACKVFTWGQKVLNAGNKMRIELVGRGDIGRIQYRITTY